MISSKPNKHETEVQENAVSYQSWSTRPCAIECYTFHLSLVQLLLSTQTS